MKKASIFLMTILLAYPLLSQQRSGNLLGKVVDGDGNPLPGVAVTLTGSRTPPVRVVTSRKGSFKFQSLFPANDYVLTAELQGFKPLVWERIIVTAGRNVGIVLPMQQGVVEESAMAVATVPVVDAEKPTVGIDMTRDMLQSLPSARDPWDILQEAPGIVSSPDNVGGIFTGQTAAGYSRAGLNGDNTWSLDGLVVSDPTAVGNPSTYWDFDVFEEMKVTSGGGDVTQQTGGIQINLVSRRGGNRLSVGGRLYGITSGFQADTYNDELASEGLAGINKFDRLLDLGINAGLPIFKDKAWFWGSLGTQDIRTFTVNGNPDNTLLTTGAAKINIQLIPQNRLELSAQGNRRLRKGSDQTASNPEGMLERPIFKFGFPVLKAQDEHMFGSNVLLSAKFGAYNGGFELTPQRDPERQTIAIWDEEAQRYYGAHRYYRADKWVFDTSFLMTIFNETLFGAEHEFKLGFDISNRANSEIDDRIPGNVMITQNYMTPQADFDDDGEPDVPADPNFKSLYFERGWRENQGVKTWSAFLSDSISFGRFGLTLGLRYDYQRPLTRSLIIYGAETGAPQWGTQYFTSEASYRLAGLLPYAEVPARDAYSSDGSKYAWRDLQPRIALSYDIFGDGKTIAKLAYSRYASWMGSGEASRWRQNASGWMKFYWWDTDEDEIVDDSELYWYTTGNYSLYPVVDEGGVFVGDWEDAAGVFWGGFDYTDPRELSLLYNSIQADAQSPRTHEVILALEREILPEFAIEVSAMYRRYDHFVWSLKYFPDSGVIQNADWYVEANPVPSEIPGLGNTGEASQHPWYYTSAEGTGYSPWANETLRPDYYEDYWGLDLVFDKRLSNRWMFNGSFTLQDSRRHYGQIGLLDGTNSWAWEGQPTNSGFVKAMIKFSGLYQLPWDIAASFTYQGRQGWIVNETFEIVDYTLPNPLSNSATLLMKPYGSERLPFLHKLNVRLEKMFRFGEMGRLYVMADVFNLLNASTATNRSDKFYGTYYVYSDPGLNTWVPNGDAYRLNRILNPRVLRLGIRFQF